jgi:hypothetical protein
MLTAQSLKYIAIAPVDMNKSVRKKAVPEVQAAIIVYPFRARQFWVKPNALARPPRCG